MNQIAIIFTGNCLFKGSTMSKKNPANANRILIINNIMFEIKSIRNIFIKHLVHSKNTHYLCAH